MADEMLLFFATGGVLAATGAVVAGGGVEDAGSLASLRAAVVLTWAADDDEVWAESADALALGACVVTVAPSERGEDEKGGSIVKEQRLCALLIIFLSLP